MSSARIQTRFNEQQMNVLMQKGTENTFNKCVSQFLFRYSGERDLN